MTSADTGGVLVSDFDGTMTRYDFYRLVVDELLPPDVPDFWEEFRAGHITHFEALRRYFAAIRSSEANVLAVVSRMELDPQLPGAIAALRSAGWRVVVASAGCEWYIRRLIDHTGIDVEVHANPGRFEPGKGLLMEMPADASPYRSSALGIDKSGVVRDYLDRGVTVAFAGDGFPDVDPARLVPPDLRFARGDLAHVLTGERSSFRAFASWSDIAHDLIALRA